MGLKQDLIDAKVKAIQDSYDEESVEVDISAGSYIEREAHHTSRAIIKALREANFTITQLKAPVVVEELKVPEQPVNIELETLLGEYQPVLKLLKQLGNPVGLGPAIDRLESEIEKAVIPLLEGGAKMAGIDINKTDGGALQSTGYVFIGEDPDTQNQFDVNNEEGQREFTTVKLLDDDARDLL
tara:strand:- start:467 stop:1018 length:552 start_codon:yes stop_codon:yes gene_type:complete